MIDSTETTRPTRNRLMVAMSVSVCIVALLLVLIGLVSNLARLSPRNDGTVSEALTVLIKNESRIQVPERPIESDEDLLPAPQGPVVSGERPAAEPEPVPEEIPEPPDQRPPTSDWYAIGEHIVKSTVADYFDQKEATAALWRRSPSVMFDSGEELVRKIEEPVLADFRFVPEIHVLGLGVTIGSCFIGLPVAGVPVEQRSTLITLFVCAEGS